MITPVHFASIRHSQFNNAGDDDDDDAIYTMNKTDVGGQLRENYQ